MPALKEGKDSKKSNPETLSYKKHLGTSHSSDQTFLYLIN